MAKFPQQYSNINGLPRIKARRVTVNTDTVDYGFNPDWDRNPFSGILIVYLTDLPEGTTTTLPVRFNMAGNTLNVTLAFPKSTHSADFVIFQDPGSPSG